MNTNNLFINPILCENYAWVDAKLEENFYDYVVEEEDDINLNYETFGLMDQEEYQDQEESDFNLLVRNLHELIAYHQDRRQRRSCELRDLFGFMNTQSVSL